MLLIKKILTIFKSGINETIIAITFFASILIMILPLPSFLIDFIIAINISFSMFLLLLAITLRNPLELTIFPSILLTTTLLRLALSISTTKLILLERNAGDIIQSFGDFVVGGNLIVGLVIFVIITIVQFLVITKGAERVAEVGARFTLDGMPGKQMSIDGDMRAGVIDASQAKKQRDQLQKESQLYGAMDGSMKFVKGDAIAGIIIVFINLFGGVLIGIFQFDMNFASAIKLFAILTVGDALVAQIPALIIAVTAALIVTRVPSDTNNNLSGDIAHQLSSNMTPLFISGALVFLISFVPGFPTIMFMSISIILVLLGYKIRHKSYNKEQSNEQFVLTDFDELLSPLVLKISNSLLSNELHLKLSKLHNDYYLSNGIPLPEIKILKINNNNEKSEVELLLYNEPILTINPSKSKNYIISKISDLDISSEKERVANNKYIYYVDHDKHENYKVLTTSDSVIMNSVCLALQNNLKDFIGIQETKYLMDLVQGRYDELVREVQRHIGTAKIAEVLQRLADENISIRDLRSIFEALITWAGKEKDIVILCEYVRISLRRQIISKFCGVNGLDVLMLDANLENEIRESIRQTSSGSYLNLTTERTNAIINEIKTCSFGFVDLVIITSLDIRRYVRKIIENENYDLHVLSFQEVGNDININVKGTIRNV